MPLQNLEAVYFNMLQNPEKSVDIVLSEGGNEPDSYDDWLKEHGFGEENKPLAGEEADFFFRHALRYYFSPTKNELRLRGGYDLTGGGTL